MAYRVALADSAKADAYAIYNRVASAAPHRESMKNRALNPAVAITP